MDQDDKLPFAFLNFAESVKAEGHRDLRNCGAYRDGNFYGGFAEALEDQLLRKAGPYIDYRISRPYRACVEWLRQKASQGVSLRKALHHEARQRFGSVLTVEMFNAAYQEVFKKPRGRPPKK